MTTQNTEECHFSALPCTVLFNCLQRILRAGRIKPAMTAPLIGREYSSIKSNRTEHNFFYHYRSSNIPCARQSFKKEASMAWYPCIAPSFRTTNTKSQDTEIALRCRRKASRSSLVTRCRTTLLPIFFDALIPMRGSPVVRGLT